MQLKLTKRTVDGILAIECNGQGLATQSELQHHCGYDNLYIWQHEDARDPRSRYTKAFGWQTEMLGPDMGDYVTVTTTESDDGGPKNNFAKSSIDFFPPLLARMIVSASSQISPDSS